MFYSGIWGVVCGARWDMVDAAVVCRLLGFGGVSTYQGNITFKPENDTIWMSEVQCIGNETSLSQCGQVGWGKFSCVERQAAGVTCFEQGKQALVFTFRTSFLNQEKRPNRGGTCFEQGSISNCCSTSR